MENQRCVKCGEVFPFTNEFYYKQKGSKGGLRKKCKICVKAETIKYYMENEEKYKYDPKTMDYDHKLLKAARKNKSITQEQLSRMIDITCCGYAKIERGLVKKVSKDTYKKICEILEIESEK